MLNATQRILPSRVTRVEKLRPLTVVYEREPTARVYSTTNRNDEISSMNERVNASG